MKVSEQFKRIIEEYVEKRAKEDELFAKAYHKDGKSIDECCDFIVAQVKQTGCCGFSDEEIFCFAVHYYDEDNLGDIPKYSCKVAVNLSDHTKEILEKQAEEDYRRDKLDEIENREKAKKDELRKKAEQKRQADTAEGQLNLFDF